MLALFEGRPRRELVQQFEALSRSFLADDLYTPARKALGLVALGLAIAVPAPWRVAWLNAALRLRPLLRGLR